MVKHLKLPYPLYSDPAFRVFESYGTGHILFGPKQAWVAIGADGLIKYIWRSGDDGKTSRVPLPREILEEVTPLLR